MNHTGVLTNPDKMAVITFENPGNSDPIPECMICCQNILDGECINKEYHCTHIFHEECLSKWLYISFMCPACKAFIYEPPPEVTPTDRRLQAMREEWSSLVIEADQLDRNVFENRLGIHPPTYLDI